MQTTFAVNMLALVENQTQPKILSLRHILDEYLTFQEELIVRRTKFDLKKALERAHLLEGLLIAEENIDEVIKIIRESYDDAKENLMARFNLSDVQAQAILDMQLKRRVSSARSCRPNMRSWSAASPTSAPFSRIRRRSSRCSRTS